MTALDIFRFEGEQVRTVIIDGEPWFVARDACDVLGISKYRDAVAQLADDERVSAAVDTLGGRQQMVAVNEPGLYALMFISRSPKVRPFQRWVTHEVLPQIRRTGEFKQTEVEHALPASYAEALRQLAEQVEVRAALEAKAVEDAPKVEAYDRWMDADGYYPVDAVAKILGLGRNNLYAALRDAGVIMTGSTRPYQRYAHHFAIVAGTTFGGRAFQTTKVRPSGIPFIAKKLGIALDEKAVA